MILTLVEHNGGTLSDLSLQALGLAHRLAAQLNVESNAVLIGQDGNALVNALGAFGVKTAYVVTHPQLDGYAPEAWAEACTQLAGAHNAHALLAAGSERGNELLARVGAQLNQPMAANCTEVQPGESYIVTRLRGGGSLLEEARLQGSPKLFTVAPYAIAPVPAPSPTLPETAAFTPTLSERALRVRVTQIDERAQDRVSLADARVVVGGGRGVGSAENFRALEALAQELGGAVGCSRAVTSLGWRPHADQVGQTGTRIAPDLYIACGVSGAIQHMIGCKASKKILAINTDPEATIVAKADYAVIGDLNKVVPAITAELRKSKAA